MDGSPEQCKTMMTCLLSSCVESGFVVEADCDEVMQQFDDFIHTYANGELENFSVADDRLDTFIRNRMAANYPKAWSVCELALLLSHGQIIFVQKIVKITLRKTPQKIADTTAALF